MYFTVQVLGIDTNCYGIAFPYTVLFIDVEIPTLQCQINVGVPIIRGVGKTSKI